MMIRSNKTAPLRYLLLLVLLALLPAGAHAAPPAPFAAPYADAMRPQFRGDVERPDLPHYTVHMDINPVTGELRGTLDLLFRNMSGVMLPNAVLRLYANFPRDVFGDGGTGAAAVADVHVNGQAVRPSYIAQRTAVRLPFPKKLTPGDDVHISLSWSAHIAALRGTDDTLVLTSAIPQLAVWDGRWRTDITALPDH